MEAIIIVSLIVAAWAISSICSKNQSKTKKLWKSILAGWFFAGVGSAATTPEASSISIIILVIGIAIIAYSNHQNTKKTSSNDDIFREHREALKSFEFEGEITKKRTYRETKFTSKFTDTELTKVAFHYVNSKGEETFRDVDIKSYDGHYLEGYCHLSRQLRTFILNRIEGDIIIRTTGELLDPYQWATMLAD
ncbi:hypothetical protein ACMV8I_03310 [Ewingella sp. S1.OA.A_B6]